MQLAQAPNEPPHERAARLTPRRTANLEATDSSGAEAESLLRRTPMSHTVAHGHGHGGIPHAIGVTHGNMLRSHMPPMPSASPPAPHMEADTPRKPDEPTSPTSEADHLLRMQAAMQAATLHATAVHGAAVPVSSPVAAAAVPAVAAAAPGLTPAEKAKSVNSAVRGRPCMSACHQLPHAFCCMLLVQSSSRRGCAFPLALYHWRISDRRMDAVRALAEHARTARCRRAAHGTTDSYVGRVELTE